MAPNDTQKFFFDDDRDGTTNISWAFGPAEVQTTLFAKWAGTTVLPGIARELPPASTLSKFFLAKASPPTNATTVNFVYGTEFDEKLSGHWDGMASAYLGLKRNVGGVAKFLLDFGDAGAPERKFSLGLFIDQTVVGFWGKEHGAGNVADGISNIADVKEVGVGLKWVLQHSDGTYTRVNFGTFATDVPLSGDVNGDGISDLIVVRAIGGGNTKWFIDLGPNWDGVPNFKFNFGVVNANTSNMVCDFTGDGNDNVGFAEQVLGENKLKFTTKDDLVPGPANAPVTYGSATDKPFWGVFSLSP